MSKVFRIYKKELPVQLLLFLELMCKYICINTVPYNQLLHYGKKYRWSLFEL